MLRIHGHRTVAPFGVVRHAANAVTPHCPGAAIGAPNAIVAAGGVPAGAAPSARPRAFNLTRSVPSGWIARTVALTIPFDADGLRYVHAVPPPFADQFEPAGAVRSARTTPALVVRMRRRPCAIRSIGGLVVTATVPRSLS